MLLSCIAEMSTLGLEIIRQDLRSVLVIVREYHLTELSHSALTLHNEVVNVLLSVADFINAGVIASIIQLNVRYI